MKRCPQCNRVEPDEALKFCRVDGATLVSDFSSLGSEAATARVGPESASSEIETSILPHATDAGINRSVGATTVFEAQQTLAQTRKLSSLKHRRAFVLLIAGLIVIALAASIYFYRSRNNNNPAIDSIAVLPFVNANGDPNTDYLSDGITESIINTLSQLPNLGVIARNSAFRYKGKDTDAPTVGRELKVRSVLTGRVLQRGDNLSISVELVDTTNNHQLWGQHYDRKLEDVFAVQQEIAREISEKLRVKLSGAEQKQLAKRPTENLRAFQYYTQSRAYIHRRTREDLLTTIQYDDKALQEDPNYALAYAGLAEAYVNLWGRGYIAPIEGRRQAEDAARKALALDENLAEAHIAVALTYIFFVPANFIAGDRELQRAIELSPSLAMAHGYLAFSLLKQGRLDEALGESLKAREFDPLSSINERAVALCYHLKREYARSLELLRHANELGPAFSTQWEFGPYVQNGLFNEALAELDKAKQDRKNDPLLILDTGMVYAARGERAKALESIKQLEDLSGPGLDQAPWIAKIYATLNEKEPALTWLERGLETGAVGFFYKDEPVWDPIRNDPRFAELLRRMGIPQ